MAAGSQEHASTPMLQSDLAKEEDPAPTTSIPMPSTLTSDFVRSWAPKVLMCQAIRGELMGVDEHVRYVKASADFNLILLTFFSFVPKSGKRISMPIFGCTSDHRDASLSIDQGSRG